MTPHEQHTLETFLQYGDLKNANLVFVGLEEGLGGNSVRNELDARTALSNNPIFQPFRVYINGSNINDGWYVEDNRCLTQAQCLASKKNVLPLNTIINKFAQTMMFQALLHWLLQGNNRSTNYHNMPSSFTNYQGIHNKGGNSAMIDFLPFPNVGTDPKMWPMEYKQLNTKGIITHLFPKRNDYYDYYMNSIKNPRSKIIKDLYNKFPMSVSIVFTGRQNNAFRLEPFYTSLGFKFNPAQSVGIVHPSFTHHINSATSKHNFKIGQRVRKDGKIQKVILTPFFSTRFLTYQNIVAISTWI